MNQLRRTLESLSLNNEDFVPYVTSLLRRMSDREPRNRSISTFSDDSCIEDLSKFEKQPPPRGRTFRTKVYKKRSMKKDLI